MVDGYELAPAAAAQLDELLAVVQRLKDEAAPNMTVRVSGGWHVQWIARVNKSSAVGDYYAYRRDDPSRRCRSRRELLRALSASDPADVSHSSLFSSARSDRDCDDVGDDGGSASESSDVDSDDVDQRNIMKGRRRRAEVNYSERPNSDSSDSSGCGSSGGGGVDANTKSANAEVLGCTGCLGSSNASSVARQQLAHLEC
ncbi:hypothetical protein EMIHUDRAFT_225487 [Emiliania huxleyi CCMP1516]|nr:hypothetical protein EMIHUDRAFT_225487 [Emiliania huxleyi CCMP1516]EOD37349.1 hypothetical protein EMIHUDRAFT_225487 [Emiliania huxleyi CCMP1516]|eukprot:XP_005789778.1 hypothetical protein EMIHUDRAFT_225487 [Emiliania huxleyi CCMP1516]